MIRTPRAVPPSSLFDREARLADERASQRGSRAALERRDEETPFRRPLGLSGLRYMIARQLDGIARLEAELLLANEWLDQLRAMRDDEVSKTQDPPLSPPDGGR